MSDPPDDLELAQARIGRVLNDKWTLERLLGVGGMAAVYEARHRNGARAAVKILHAELGLQPNLRERFVHEGYAANRVEHPDVVKVLDDDVVEGGPDDGAAFLVMELLEGRSLEARVADGAPIAEVELLEIVDAVLAVLESAHARGIIHRDLKPENLFLVAGEDGSHSQVKVLDFGIARTVESRGLTVHGVPMGTPAFMAPEQASGRIDDIDGRTDLFALGATMFTVLAGRSVHEGDDPLEAMYKMVKEQAPPLRSVAPGVSEACARIVDKALQLERDSRYASATAMRADVRAILDAGRTQPVTFATAPTLAAASAPDEPVALPRKSGCGPRILFAVFLLMCAAGAWMAFGNGLPRALRDALGVVPVVSASVPETPSGTASPSSSSSAAPVPLIVIVDAEAEASEDAARDASDDVDESDDDAGDDASREASAPDASPLVHLAATPKPTATARPPVVTHPTAKPTTTKPKPHH